VKAALKEQANAFVNMAGKCQTIFTAQQAMTEIIPDQSDDCAFQHGKFCFVYSKCKFYTCTSNSDGV